MKLNQMLAECLDGCESRTAFTPVHDNTSELSLPASVLDWPDKWYQMLDESSRVTKQLLPICELYAESAVEIALRCVWAHQHGGRFLS